MSRTVYEPARARRVGAPMIGLSLVVSLALGPAVVDDDERTFARAAPPLDTPVVAATRPPGDPPPRPRQERSPSRGEYKPPPREEPHLFTLTVVDKTICGDRRATVVSSEPLAWPIFLAAPLALPLVPLTAAIGLVAGASYAIWRGKLDAIGAMIVVTGLAIGVFWPFAGGLIVKELLHRETRARADLALAEVPPCEPL